MSEAASRLIAWWNVVAERWNPIVLIVAVWAVLALPLVYFRGFNSDEGVAVTIARTAIEDGYWITPHMFNLRFAERPTLLSWIIAAVSLPFGGVSQFTARLPIILSLLGGCLLIFWLLRRVASLPAALLGAALFLACPLVLRAYVMTTADLPLAVLLFSAFVLWWNGVTAGSLTHGRWAGIGLVLALAALMKGPQPVGYFALGVGVFVLVTRAWRQIPGLLLAGLICVIPLAAWYAYLYTPDEARQWASFMRLSASIPLAGPVKATLDIVINTLPAVILAAAFLLTDRFRGSERVPPAFVTALACYAFTCTIAVLFWPGGSAARYFFPMVLPLCVLGGLAYDALAVRMPLLVAPVLVATLAILGYAFLYSVVASPLMPLQFRSAWLDAVRITDLVRAAPAPIYRTGTTALNVLPYVPARILSADMGTLETLRGPAWIVLPLEEAAALLARRQGIVRPVISLGRPEEWRLLRIDN